MKSIDQTSLERPHAATDLAIAWALLLLGLARIGIAVLRHEPGGVEVGISTLVAALAAIEIVRIAIRRRHMKREAGAKRNEHIR